MAAALFASGCENGATPPPLAESVTVTAPATSLVAGDSLRLAAAVRDGSGRAIERPVTWSSSSNAVATINLAGTVTAVSAGPVTITATADGKSGSVELSVAAAVGALTVTVETVGDLPDPDGYEITRNGLVVGRVGVNGTLQVQDLEVGSYSIGLRDASLQCGPEGGTARTAAVERGAITPVTFRVECRRDGVAYLAYMTAGAEQATLWLHFPGRATHSITSGSAGSRAAWSPDGRRLAYPGRHPTYGIFVLDLDSRATTRITTEYANTPVWSPDGSEIAYMTLEEIRVVASDGTSDRAVWRGSMDHHPGAPTWSPDGDRIAFARLEVPFVHDLIVMNRDGSGLRQVRRMRTLRGSPVWSPEGDRILYADADPNERARLYTADVTTGAEVLVHEMDDHHVSNPAYLRDGRIGFSVSTLIGPYPSGFWTMYRDGSGLTRYPLPAEATHPVYVAWQ